MTTRVAKRTQTRVRRKKALPRERRAPYRVRRWKIPAITPIGANAPVSQTLPLAMK